MEDNDVHSVLGAVILERAGQRIVVSDSGRNVNSMEHHVGHGQHVGQRLFLDSVDGVLQDGHVLRCFGLLLEMLDGTGEKAARTAGRIENRLAQTWVENIDHELRHSTRSVVFASIASRLQIGKNLLVNVVEEVPVLRGVEIHILFNRVDDLPQECTRLHVVVGILKDGTNNLAARRDARSGSKALERWK